MVAGSECMAMDVTSDNTVVMAICSGASINYQGTDHVRLRTIAQQAANAGTSSIRFIIQVSNEVPDFPLQEFVQHVGEDRAIERAAFLARARPYVMFGTDLVAQETIYSTKFPNTTDLAMQLLEKALGVNTVTGYRGGATGGQTIAHRLLIGKWVQEFLDRRNDALPGLPDQAARWNLGVIM